MRAGQGLGEDLQRREPVVSGAWSGIQTISDAVQIVLAEDAQVRALGQVLAQQPVGVLASAALPGAVWIAEVHRHAGASCEVLVARQFLALVIGQALAHRLGNELSLALKPASADAAVASSIFASSTRRLERSTSTPTED